MASYYSAPYDGGGNNTTDNNANAYYHYGQEQTTQNHEQQQQQPQPYGQQAPYGNANQWQTSAQQQQQQYQPSSSTGMQQQQPSFWNPATAASMAAAAASLAAGSMGQNGAGGGAGAGGALSNPDVMFNFASTAGKSFLQNSSARMIPGLEATMKNVRGYFAVDNRYVKTKMLRILFPFLNKYWARTSSQPIPPENLVVYALPNSDDNAPDLYIPMMSFITYVLLCAMVYGNAGQFSPEVLTDVALWCFVFQVLEVIGIRVGFYLLQAPVAILDLFSYTGYKYLGLCVNMIAGIALNHFGIGKEAYYIFFLYTASAASYFMLKTMANNIPLQTRQGGPKRELVVVAFAASPFATMYFVSKTKFLS